jgi:hypothetical protein
MLTKLTLNGHPEKIAADLAAARDAVIAGKSAFIDFESEDGEGEIEFVTDTTEFGLEDKLYAEVGE